MASRNGIFSALVWAEKGKFGASTLSYKTCPRKQTTEPKLLIWVSFFSGEVTSCIDTSFCINILWELGSTPFHFFLGHPVYAQCIHTVINTMYALLGRCVRFAWWQYANTEGQCMVHAICKFCKWDIDVDPGWENLLFSCWPLVALWVVNPAYFGSWVRQKILFPFNYRKIGVTLDMPRKKHILFYNLLLLNRFSKIILTYSFEAIYQHYKWL